MICATLLKFVVDALSRLEINGIKTLQDGIDYEYVAVDQNTDPYVTLLLENLTATELQLSGYFIPKSNRMLWCFLRL